MRWKLEKPTDARLDIFIKVGKCLETLGHEIIWFTENACIERIREEIRHDNFDKLLLWSRPYPLQEIIFNAADKVHKEIISIDYGLNMDKLSVIFASPQKRASQRTISEVKVDNTFFGNFATHIPVKCPNTLIQNIQLPFIFVPIDLSNASVQKHDEELWGNFIRRILFLAAHKYFVVIRVSPSPLDFDLGIPTILNYHHIIVSPSVDEELKLHDEYCIQNTALVVGGNMNTLLHAMIHDKPIIAIGKGWYSDTDCLHVFEDIGALHDLRIGATTFATRMNLLCEFRRKQVELNSLNNPDVLQDVLSTIDFDYNTND